MKTVFAFPHVEDVDCLADLISRFAWHFGHLKDRVRFVIPIAECLVGKGICLPAGFDSAIKDHINSMKGAIELRPVKDPQQTLKLLGNCDVVMKHTQGTEWVEEALKNFQGKVYRVDPKKIRQEGSFYIQAALDLRGDQESLVEKCRQKFNKLKQRLGTYQTCWVLATGPSIEDFAHCDFPESFAIACNSTILNEQLMAVAKPKVLVFADPIFHFGVSEYAGAFRDAVRVWLRDPDNTVIVPFKYYPLLISVMPEFERQIIGIPFKRKGKFNLSIDKEFEVMVTANILTLLLLPLATTFANEVRLIGCDGRPLNDNQYFWGHGKSVQINEKMKNIQEVHPGFFDIDYNEYYFEHCHTLENLILQGEHAGKKFSHYGSSYIPALKERSIPVDGRGHHHSVSEDSDFYLLIESDGIGTSGHYVVWHNQLIESLRLRGKPIHVFCNRKQDPQLYSAEARPIFTSHSWAVSRSDQSFRRDFVGANSYVSFKNELVSELILLCGRHEAKQVSLFIYYGSVQLLRLLQEARSALAEKGVNLKVTICLFHESVILKDMYKEPRFPANAKEILLESVAQTEDFTVVSVTEQLSDYILERFGVRTAVLPNPIPSLGDETQNPACTDVDEMSTSMLDRGRFNVLFPCRLRPEKGSDITYKFLNALPDADAGSYVKVVVRGLSTSLSPNTVTAMNDDVSDGVYRKNFSECDVVVIPYLSPHFTFRTSGVLVDALYAGKPCIVLEGTWMASIVRKLRVGLVVRYYAPATILSAISTIQKNYGFFRRNAATAYSRYTAKNSWKAVTDTIIL